MGDEDYPWQVAGLYQGESAGQLLHECSAMLKTFSKTPNTGTFSRRNSYANYPTSPSRRTSFYVSSSSHPKGRPEEESLHGNNYMKSKFATLGKLFRLSSTTCNNETQSVTGRPVEEKLHGNNPMKSKFATLGKGFRLSSSTCNNETQSVTVENKLSRRATMIYPKPFTYLNDSDLSNRLLAGKSKAESTRIIQVEQSDLDTSEKSEIEFQNGFMRKGMTDTSSRTQSTVSSNSQSAYGRNVENKIDRLVRHFEGTLYQNNSFLEDAKSTSGKDRTPVIEDETQKPLAIETLKNQEIHEHNIELTESSGCGTKTSLTRSNSTTVFKDLVKPQQTPRKLWSDMPQVKASSYLDKATPTQKKLQESKFEVITSEASYFRSLVVLETHFALRLTNYLTKAQYKFIFGLVTPVRKVSEVLLRELCQCFEQNVLMTNMGHILLDVVKDSFQIYITYCKNYSLIEKTLQEVRMEEKFEKELKNLESNPVCQKLNLHSYLNLPAQRFQKFPLLVETILKNLNHQDIECKIWEKLLKIVKMNAHECDNAIAEMDYIVKQYVRLRDFAALLKFSQWIPPLALQSSSRTLLLQDTFNILLMNQTEATEVGSVSLTLLSDYLILAKPDRNKHYQVITYCRRDKAWIKTVGSLGTKRFIELKLAANYRGVSERWFLGIDDITKCEEIIKNWLGALPQYKDVEERCVSLGRSDVLVKALYEFCPRQSDELELKRGELLRIKSKSDDGWCLGERVRDGKVGWFPQNFTSLGSQAKEMEETANN